MCIKCESDLVLNEKKQLVCPVCKEVRISGTGNVTVKIDGKSIFYNRA